MIEIQLTNGGTAHVDSEYAHLAALRWHRNSQGYATHNLPRGSAGGVVRLHRVVLGLLPGDGLEGDHIDGNRLDCRHSNLRIVSHAANCQNWGGQRGVSSYRGVSYDTRRKKWYARCTVAGKSNHLGYFESETEAAEVARRFRVEHLPYTNESRASA